MGRRDGKERIIPGEMYWIIGAYNRRNRTIELKVVRKRNAAMFKGFCRQLIPKEACINTEK